MGSACNRYGDKGLRTHKVVAPSPHAVVHDAWLGVGPSGIDRAVNTLSDAIHTGSCTQEEAGRIATTTLGRCRGGNSNGKTQGMLAIVQEDYFAKLQQVRKSKKCLRTGESFVLSMIISVLIIVVRFDNVSGWNCQWRALQLYAESN